MEQANVLFEEATLAGHGRLDLGEGLVDAGRVGAAGLGHVGPAAAGAADRGGRVLDEDRGREPAEQVLADGDDEADLAAVLLGVPETYYLKCFILRKLA